MPVLVPREFIPVRPQKGGLVHATSMLTPRKTLCGTKCDGWVIEPKRLSCPDCRAFFSTQNILPVKKEKRAGSRAR